MPRINKKGLYNTGKEGMSDLCRPMEYVNQRIGRAKKKEKREKKNAIQRKKKKINDL